MKLWQKKTKLDKSIEEFTVGNDFLLDKKLVSFDCIASIAHAKMLAKIGILEKKEAQALEKELLKIKKLSEKGKFEVKKEDEDCHTAIENHLTKKLGDTGKKIHSCRSRNDQVLAALRLYSKAQVIETKKAANSLIGALKKLAAKNKSGKMPGYTHLQRAMPSSVSLWANAFADSLADDLLLLDFSAKLVDQNPLGSAAGYGVPIKIDRMLTTKLLGFSKLQENPLYCANSRGKFESILLSALVQLMLDVNKIATDLLLFSTKEFGFFELPEKFCTGSSIMPQKKNPDVLELCRAKNAIVQAELFKTLSIISSLPSGYNRDFQLTKEPLINGFETTIACLKILSLVIAGLKVNKKACAVAMTPELFATENALKKVVSGIPFRDAYKQAAAELTEKN